MKTIVPLLSVLALAIMVTGCETTPKKNCCGGSHCADARPRLEHGSVSKKAGTDLFRPGQSAPAVAANDTARTEAPLPY